MGKLMRLWKANCQERFAGPSVSDVDNPNLDMRIDLHTQPMLHSWQPAKLTWFRDSPNHPLPDISIPTWYGSICFRRSMSDLLLPSRGNEIELLPACLDGEDWVIVHCLRNVTEIDLSISEVRNSPQPDYPLVIAEIHWVNIVIPNSIDLDLLYIPAFSHPMAPRHLLLTDAFVDRVQAFGLRGLDFKHVGYIVPDASQAVPRPPAPPAPPPKASKRKPPKFSAEPMAMRDLAEILAAGARWRERLQLTRDASPQSILKGITVEMNALRPTWWDVTADARIDASLGLAAIYGELLCKACGWSWIELRQSRSKRWIAVAGPDHRHAVALLPYVHQQIETPDPTVTLLFNMIAAADLPAADPGALVVVAG